MPQHKYAIFCLLSGSFYGSPESQKTSSDGYESTGEVPDQKGKT